MAIFAGSQPTCLWFKQTGRTSISIIYKGYVMKEALKLELEALENAEYGDYDKKELNEAITAIKEALEKNT